MAWQSLSVVSQGAKAELVASLLTSLGALSVMFEDAADQPFYEPRPGETPLWSRTKISALFEGSADLMSIQSFLLEQLGQAVLTDWRIQPLDDQAWERAWLKFFRPMRFGRRLWVCPAGREALEGSAVCVMLNPGLAFGTGTHPTTALCLEWLDEHPPEGERVIDYGCGSGILAIASLALGAREAFAVDIDPQALSAARHNAFKNRVQTRLHCCYPDQLPALKADVVLANILANPLIELSSTFAHLVRPGGKLVLSGILREQVEAVSRAYEAAFYLERPVFKEDWARLSGIRYRP